MIDNKEVVEKGMISLVLAVLIYSSLGIFYKVALEVWCIAYGLIY